jgi:hypothetical protein
MFQMLGLFAEFERTMTRERVLSGMARARFSGTKSGKAIGRLPGLGIELSIRIEARAVLAPAKNGESVLEWLPVQILHEDGLGGNGSAGSTTRSDRVVVESPRQRANPLQILLRRRDPLDEGLEETRGTRDVKMRKADAAKGIAHHVLALSDIRRPLPARSGWIGRRCAVPLDPPLRHGERRNQDP